MRNPSGSIIDLSGCRLALGITFDFLSTGNWTPASGARPVLASNAAAFAVRYPTSPVVGSFANRTNLSNGGERPTLLHAANVPISDLVHNGDPPWPDAADGSGFLIVLKNADPHPGPRARE